MRQLCDTLLLPAQVNLRLALSVQFHTVWHFVAIYGSIALWLAFVCAYNALPLGLLGSIAHQENIYFVVFLLLRWPAAWVCLPLGAHSTLLVAANPGWP